MQDWTSAGTRIIALGCSQRHDVATGETPSEYGQPEIRKKTPRYQYAAPFPVLGRVDSQIQFCADHVVLEAGVHLETQLDAQGTHFAVLRKHVRDQLLELGLARYSDQAGVEFRAQAFVLRRVDGHRRQLALVAAVDLAQSSNGQQLGFAGRVLALSDQRHLAVVVDETDAREALMRGPLGELQRLEVPQVDAALRQLLVEGNHQRLVLRTNRPDNHFVSVLHLPRRNQLDRIRVNGGLGEFVSRDLGSVNDHARIQRQQPL